MHLASVRGGAQVRETSFLAHQYALQAVSHAKFGSVAPKPVMDKVKPTVSVHSSRSWVRKEIVVLAGGKRNSSRDFVRRSGVGTFSPLFFLLYSNLQFFCLVRTTPLARDAVERKKKCRRSCKAKSRLGEQLPYGSERLLATPA